MIIRQQQCWLLVPKKCKGKTSRLLQYSRITVFENYLTYCNRNDILYVCVRERERDEHMLTEKEDPLMLNLLRIALHVCPGTYTGLENLVDFP